MEDEFIDSESSFGSKKVAYSDLIVASLSKILTICAKEFKKGYWENKPINVGGSTIMSKVYHEDSRLSYINAVNYLHDLLLPKFDKTMEEEIKKLDEAEDKEKKSHEEKESTLTKWIDVQLTFKRKLFQQITLLIGRRKLLESTFGGE